MIPLTGKWNTGIETSFIDNTKFCIFEFEVVMGCHSEDSKFRFREGLNLERYI